MVSVGGTSGMTQFEISDNRYIAELNVAIPTLYAGVESELEITAVDQFGIELSDAELYELCKGAVASVDGTTAKVTLGDTNALINQGSSIAATEANGGTFKVVKNAAKKTFKVKYTPGNEDTDTQALFTITSAAPNVSVQYVTVKAAAQPAGIKGLADSVATVVRVDQNAEAALGTLGNVLFTDTYGNVWAGAQPRYVEAAPTTTDYEGFYYTVTGTPKYTSFDAASGTVSGKATTGAAIGADTYKITLYQVKDAKVNSLANKEVKITNSVGDFEAYTAVFVSGMGQQKDSLYVGTPADGSTYPIDAATLVVLGIDAGGNAVTLTDGYNAALRYSTVAGATLGYDDGVLSVTDASELTAVTTEDAIVDVFVDNNIVTSATISCSNAESTPVMFLGQILLNGKVVGTFDPEDGLEVAENSPVYYWTMGGKVNGPVISIVDAETHYIYVVAAVDQYGCIYSDEATIGANAVAVHEQNPVGAIDAAKTITTAARNISVVVPVTAVETE